MHTAQLDQARSGPYDTRKRNGRGMARPHAAEFRLSLSEITCLIHARDRDMRIAEPGCSGSESGNQAWSGFRLRLSRTPFGLPSVSIKCDLASGARIGADCAAAEHELRPLGPGNPPMQAPMRSARVDYRKHDHYRSLEQRVSHGLGASRRSYAHVPTLQEAGRRGHSGTSLARVYG